MKNFHETERTKSQLQMKQTSHKNRPQVNSSSNKEISVKDGIAPKQKYPLQTFDVFAVLDTHTEFHTLIDNYARSLFTPELINQGEINTHSLWNILWDPIYTDKLHKVLRDYYGNSLTENVSKTSPEKLKDDRSLAAFLIRCNRFRLKYAIVYNISDNCPATHLEVVRRIKEIHKDLCSKQITLDLENKPIVSSDPTSRAPFTLASTIQLMAQSLSDIEIRLKQLLPALLDSYGMLFPNIIQDRPLVAASLRAIAPPGFVGVESDYYYITHLFLREKDLPFFNPEQLKQWSTYRQEMDHLFCFLGGIHARGPFPLPLLMATQTKTINIPYGIFMASTSTSKNTFARIINACNQYVLLSWMTASVTISQGFMPMDLSKK